MNLKKTKDILSIILMVGIILGTIFLVVKYEINKKNLPLCQIEKYFIGKGTNEFIVGEYQIDENGCICFNDRVACGKYTIENKVNTNGECRYPN